MPQEILLSHQSKIEEIQKEILPHNITNILVIGLGASVLNTRAISSFSKAERNLLFLDSIEEIAIEQTIKNLSNNNTAIVAISKSGYTDETILILDYLSSTKLRNSQLYIVSENKNSDIAIAGKNVSNNYKFIEYEKSISGRFSIFLNAALLPIHLAGGDISQIIEIAIKYENSLEYQTLANILLSHFRKGRNILVLSVYDSSLIGFAEWVRQIIAESLGKNNFGLTTLISRGTIDEHSQLQLYLDGPDDKIYYLLPFFAKRPNSKLSENLLKHMNNFNKAISMKNRPCLISDSENYNTKIEYGINTICKWLLATQYIAYQEKIDPFTQPAVDECKKLF